MKRVILFTVLLGMLFSCTACAGQEQSQRTEVSIIKEMTVYYARYGDGAKEKTEELLQELESLDPEAASKWQDIMGLWESVSQNIEIHENILPDGLPDSEELCLIVLGFQLNPDGSPREELIKRLEVALASAEKYPKALIVCTGGGTASRNPSVTEAGTMAQWLMEHGIAEERIVVEDQSITTAQNAIYTYQILAEKYPEVHQLAIISSDYHIATGTLLFGAQARLLADDTEDAAYAIVSNAAYHAPKGSLSTMFQAGALIELAGDVDTAFDIYYETYDIHELPELPVQQPEE